MSTEIDAKVHAELRENFGKGFARRLRAAGKIPAVIYGHGTDPQHVALPGHQVALLIRRANALLDLDIAGKSQLVLVKDVQKDPVRQIIEHIDLLVVRKGEKVQVDIPVTVVGEPFPGTIVNLENTTVSLEVEATHIPEWIEVSIEGAEAGTLIYASDLVLPKGSELLTDPETLIVNVTQQQSEEALEAELESTEDELGIEKDESEDAEAADHHPDVTLTYTDVVVTLVSHDVAGITSRDVALAREISRAAADLDVRSDVARLTQAELGLDTSAGAELAPFYAALLGGEVVQGEAVDPSGQTPTVWWQEPGGAGDDEHALPPQPFEQRWHLDVWVPHDDAEARLQAVLDAGGRLVSDRAAPAYWVVEDADGNRSCICTPEGR
mgnify:CR=1 FL=1